jgi:WD40 repeat protein
MLNLWDIPSLKVSSSDTTKKNRIVSKLAFSPDCLRLAAGFDDGTVKLWDTGCAEQAIASLKRHSKKITALAFSPDGEQLASGSEDKRVKLWGGRDGASCAILQHRFRGGLTAIALSSLLLAAATDNDTTLWDRKTLHLVHTLRGDSHHLLFSPDGSQLASTFKVFRITSVRVWDVETHIVIADFRAYAPIERLVLPANGPGFLVCYSDGGLDYFHFKDAVKQGAIINPKRNDRITMSRSVDKQYGEHLVGYFPGHRGPAPILWIPREVSITAFAAESSMFAVACNDGRMIFGQVPLVSGT